MKPNIIITVLLLLGIATIRFGRDAISANNLAAVKTSLANRSPILLTKEHAEHTDPEYYYNHANLFVPLNQIKRNIEQEKEIFWLKKELGPADSLSTSNYILSFDNLTYVDLALINGTGEIEFRKKSGLFRKR
jgi:hypothetical protein